MPRVLLLDDDNLVRTSVMELLADAEHEVVEASTGQEALMILEHRPIDVLVTDIRMPGPLNGWELAEAARQLRPQLPVVYISGFSPMPVRSVPGASYLHKPFTQAALENAMEKAITYCRWSEGFTRQAAARKARKGRV